MLVSKQKFHITNFTTIHGKLIENIDIGFETYGKLNEKKDNAILVCHYFSGNSHVAGKYDENDVSPGYWDDLIGPDKFIDTNKYFIISSDTLVNLYCQSKHVITTGPISINPKTGKSYGLDFPIVTIRDFVEVQKLLLDSLLIDGLEAIIGPSMGSMQAIEWAVAYPDMIKRVVAVIPGGLQTHPYAVAMLQTWAAPITLDPNWNRGNYYENMLKPRAGLAHALRIITVSARAPGWAETTYSRRWAIEDNNPFTDWSNYFAIESSITSLSETRSLEGDANHLLYLVKACQSYRIGNGLVSVEEAASRIQAKLLFIPASSDLLLLPQYSYEAVEILKKLGKNATCTEIKGDGGHFDGIMKITSVGAEIREFISTP
jgi:homoserine O-acetyltransferase